MPTTTAGKLTRLAAAILLPGHFAFAASAAEPEEYPIWWSPTLELESLDKIDERLDRPFWPHEDGLRIYKEVEGNYWKKVIATDCVELLGLSADGFYALENWDLYLQLFHAARCRAIRLLGAARPAETSYLRDFALTPETVEYLPAMINIAPGCARFCRHVAASANRVPMSQFEMVLGADVVHVDAELSTPNWSYLTRPFLTVWTAGWEINLEIVGRGDFDGDGVDDVLVLVNGAAMAGRQVAVNLFVLTRGKAGTVLRVVDGDHDRWVLDADPAVCTVFPCETRNAHR